MSRVQEMHIVTCPQFAIIVTALLVMHTTHAVSCSSARVSGCLVLPVIEKWGNLSFSVICSS